MPEHHRIHARRVADRAFGIRVHVGAADADGVHPHLHFARPGGSIVCSARRNSRCPISSATSIFSHCKIGQMLNYREFEAGPDPFGRKFHVYFKWLQTAISHPPRRYGRCEVHPCRRKRRADREDHRAAACGPRPACEGDRPKLDDPWCSRLAMMHLLYLISTGEDMEKDLVTVPYPDLQTVRLRTGPR